MFYEIMFPEIACKYMEEKMAYGKIRLGILIILLVFGMIGCEGISIGGTLNGTVWVSSIDGKELEFTGSNYSYDHGAIRGTYTLNIAKKELNFKETYPGEGYYSGDYYPDNSPPYIVTDYFKSFGTNEKFY